MKIKYILLCISYIFINVHAHERKAKLAFVINELSFRGMEVSTFDYAHYNETILGNESIIINFDVATNNEVRTKFVNRFGFKFFDCSSLDELDYILTHENVDILYNQKPGHYDGVLSRVCKNAVHAVFPQMLQPHGDVYAFISQWFVEEFSNFKNHPVVPYMVRVIETEENLREKLGIPRDALVFGRHGGDGSFNVPCAHDAIQEVAQARSDIYFLFLNTHEFCHLPNVIFLPKTTDMLYKAKFINTCDAMIHARWRGETFGLACAEFSIKNKPVITWTGPKERAHIRMLGNKALYYTTKEDLMNILMNFKREPTKNWDAYSHLYTPEKVMEQFNNVFIKPLTQSAAPRLLNCTQQLRCKPTRCSDGSLNMITLDHIRDVFGCDAVHSENTQSWLNVKDSSLRPLLYFDGYWRTQAMENNTFAPSVLTVLNDLDICTLHHAILMFDGISQLNKTSLEFLYKQLKTHDFSIIAYNDALLAHQEKNVFVSPLLRAMTISRLSELPDYAQQSTLNELLGAEQVIGRALNYAALTLAPYGYTIPYFHLWQGLAHLHAKHHEQAAQSFQALLEAGCNNWRIYWYLAQALYALGNPAAELAMIKVMTDCPHLRGIEEMKKTISA